MACAGQTTRSPHEWIPVWKTRKIGQKLPHPFRRRLDFDFAAKFFHDRPLEWMVVGLFHCQRVTRPRRFDYVKHGVAHLPRVLRVAEDGAVIRAHDHPGHAIG